MYRYGGGGVERDGPGVLLMPLAKGRGKSVVSGNIAEMMRKYKSSGMIGNTKPKSMAHALRIASAAAMRKAGRRKKKS